MSESGTTTTARTGFFPLVRGDEVNVQEAGALAVFSRGATSIREGGAQLVATAGDLTISEGGAQTLLSLGDVAIRQGGALLTAAKTVTVDGGVVGLALGNEVELRDSRVLLGPVQAVAVGVGIGLALAATKRWRNRGPHDDDGPEFDDLEVG